MKAIAAATTTPPGLLSVWCSACVAVAIAALSAANAKRENCAAQKQGDAPVEDKAPELRADEVPESPEDVSIDHHISQADSIALDDKSVSSDDD